MTSTVKVTAHCGDDKVVVITLTTPGQAAGELHSLTNGESKEFTVYDERVVTVREALLNPPVPPENA
jgi:hypothetical protein